MQTLGCQFDNGSQSRDAYSHIRRITYKSQTHSTDGGGSGGGISIIIIIIIITAYMECS
jgi:hypothetical protein